MPRFVAALLCCLAITSSAEAGWRVPPSTKARTYGDTKAPRGWTEFCPHYADQCQAGSAGPVTLEPASWQLLRTINRAVNREILQVTDLEHWNKEESWDLPTDHKGDCEDIALEKRKRLVESGWPVGALLMTVVLDEEKSGHAILTVGTSRGDYVLDNKTDRIKPWTATGYKFIKRQSPDDPSRWASLQDEGPAPPAATAQRN